MNLRLLLLLSVFLAPVGVFAVADRERSTARPRSTLVSRLAPQLFVLGM